MMPQAERHRIAASALVSTAELSSLAAGLGRLGIPLLVLKGPLLQQRLYGTPVAHPSSDVDVLVHPRHAATVRRYLRRSGWRFAPENMLLWRVFAAAHFERPGVILDLHWGLHAGTHPSVSLRRLNQALWDGATRADHGLYEPAIEPLLVFLAVHAAGHEFGRASWSDGIAAAARHVEDWDQVWAISRQARVEGTVRHALEVAVDGRDPRPRPVLDGWAGQVWAGGTWLCSGHFLPEGVRAGFRDAIARRTRPGP